MKFDESLIRRHKKVIGFALLVAALAGVGSFVAGILERDLSLIVWSPFATIIMIGLAIHFIKRF